MSRIDAIRDEALREHDRHLLDEITRKLLEQHQIATGPQDVIDEVPWTGGGSYGYSQSHRGHFAV